MIFPAFHGLDADTARVLVRLAVERNRDPEAIAAVIESESGWDPKAGSAPPLWSTRRTASGLIQWIESTIRSQTGITPQPGEYLTRDWLPKLSAVEQLPLVFDFYDKYLRIDNARPVDYKLAGWGDGVGRPDSYVLAAAGDMRPYHGSTIYTGNDVYERHKSLDTDHSGTVTVEDLRHLVERQIAAARARGSLDLGDPSTAAPYSPPGPPMPPPWTDYVPPAQGLEATNGDALPLVALLTLAWKAFG